MEYHVCGRDNFNCSYFDHLLLLQPFLYERYDSRCSKGLIDKGLGRQFVKVRIVGLFYKKG